MTESDPVAEARAEALAALARLGGQLNADEDVVFSGRKFILPENTTLPGAVKFLTAKIKEDEEEFAFTRVFQYRPFDGARATGMAVRKAFGFSLGRPIISFFGKQPPQLIDVATSLNTTEQVPWGAMAIPGLEGVTLYLGADHDAEYGQVFALRVTGPRKWRFEIEGLMRLVQEELEQNSIYRGQAIDGQPLPEFLDLTGVDPEDVVYADTVMQQLEANVWSPIRHTEELAKLGQPGKRAVLFEGPYGTGKTLGAFLTAQVAVKHEWTFVYCRPGRDDLDVVMQTARLYQPSVVFAEDLDTMAQPGEPDHISRMLDMFDGIGAKGLRMLLVLTTNHVERIHKGMVRPGRLDAVIHVGAMDRDGVEKLARRVIGRQSLDEATDFDAVYEAVDGFMPAFVREVFDRAVRYSVSRNDGKLGLISTEDLVWAAEGLRPQLKLMEDAQEQANGPQIETAIGTVVEAVIRKSEVQDRDGDTIFTLAVD